VIRNLAVIGLGLLGGSIARVARAQGLAERIVAIGRSRETLEAARQDGVVDEITTDVATGVRGADLVVLATPVAVLRQLLPEAWRGSGPDCILTDVGSTKGAIVRVADDLAAVRPRAFVGGHPMAGSEQSGYGVSRPDLFQGALVILTPTERTPGEALKRVSELWEAAGARVVTMDPETHDRAVAAVSHLPHLVADALVDAVLRLDPGFLGVAARGFRDTTRIAASDPQMWREIFQENREAIGEALGAFRAALSHLERLVAGGDGAAVEAELARIKGARARLENGKTAPAVRRSAR
jgi:prephenate dehydrogenase